ncbi:MAG: acetyltransferase [Erysipelotrichaceae bacterium]|nr:acetyltransferase [Erysipelotrichaceae bacterium]
MNKKILIAGANGHGKVAADIAELNGYKVIEFCDDDESIKECVGYPVIGKTDLISDYEGDVFIAIGNPVTRERFMKKRECVTLIHPNATVSKKAVIGSGCVLMAGAVVNSCAVIGEGSIVNTCASVDHDCVIGKYVHVSVGAHVAGTCTIGDRTWVGAGAIVNNNLSISNDCMIGSGTVVIDDINEPGTYVGVPAKKIK